jgi:hypothetical protein
MEIPLPPDSRQQGRPKAKAKTTKNAKNAPAIVKPADELTTVTVNGLPDGFDPEQQGQLPRPQAHQGRRRHLLQGLVRPRRDQRRRRAPQGDLQVAAAADLRAFTKGGPAHWTQEIVTEGTSAKPTRPSRSTTLKGRIEGETDATQSSRSRTSWLSCRPRPYLVDTVTIPAENPYNSWIRVGAIDFFKDGRIAFATWSGDVWVGKFADDKPSKITWRRYATGIFHGSRPEDRQRPDLRPRPATRSRSCTILQQSWRGRLLPELQQ